MSLDWEQIAQEERLWPWINDASAEEYDLPSGHWADYEMEDSDES